MGGGCTDIIMEFRWTKDMVESMKQVNGLQWDFTTGSWRNVLFHLDFLSPETRETEKESLILDQ